MAKHGQQQQRQRDERDMQAGSGLEIRELRAVLDVRIEHKATPEGRRWRATVTMLAEDGNVTETATPWKPREHFWADWALCNRKLIDFLFAGIGRPMVG